MTKKAAASTILMVLFFAAGCASGEGGRPGWVNSPPADSQGAVFFVGAGSDPGGSEVGARQMAGSQLVSEITRFLGVKITAETTVEAKDAFGEFESNVTQKINENSQAQIGDLKVVDSWTDWSSGGVTVYLLAEYDKGALLEEKARLEAVFVEREEAISGPEREGERLMTEGAYYRAALKFGEAALAAVSSEVDNAAIKFERNLNNAKEALSRIRLLSLNDNITGVLGGELEEPFRMKVTGGAGKSAPGLEGVDIRVSYKVIRRNNRLSSTSETFRTDGEGMIVFWRPPANFVGEEVLSMALDMRRILDPLSELSDPFYAQVGGLEQVINQKRVNFRYEITSLAKEIPTAVLLVDQDRGGNPLERSDTASGLLEILTGEDFAVYLLDNSPQYASLSEAELLGRLASEWEARYERIILGFAGIDSFDETDDYVIVQVSGEAKAVDLATGAVIYTANGQSRARSKSPSGTVSAAFKNLGKNLGEELINNLP